MFQLNLVTPEKRLVTGLEVEEIFVPAFRGELNVLPGHAPLMSTLTTGIVRYRAKGDTQFKMVAVSWGYCQVSPTAVNILAETAETPEEIDLDRAKYSLKLSEEKLASSDLDVEMLEKYLAKMARARVRQELKNVPTTTH